MDFSLQQGLVGFTLMLDDKVICYTPTPGKQPTRIDGWKFECVRDAILLALPEQGEGVLFKQLPALVAGLLSPQDKQKLGSVSWYTTTVKLHLETTEEIVRVLGASPQRLLKSSSL